MPRKMRKRVPKRIKQPLVQPLCPNLPWSMDFMRDSLFYGKAFRSFNVIADFNHHNCQKHYLKAGNCITGATNTVA